MKELFETADGLGMNVTKVITSNQITIDRLMNNMRISLINTVYPITSDDGRDCVVESFGESETEEEGTLNEWECIEGSKSKKIYHNAILLFANLTILSAIDKHAVAAGEGAFNT